MEQKRIQRLIDLTVFPDDADDSGTLSIEPRGRSSYCYLRWYQHGKCVRKEYLGKLHSEAVRAYVSARFRSEHLRRLTSNQQLLELLEEYYLNYDRTSVIAELPKACQALITDSTFDQRYEELRQWANADYPRNPAPFPETENYAVDGTRTRSKGGTIFYNIFIYLGVLFRFDCEIEVIDESGIMHKLHRTSPHYGYRIVSRCCKHAS